MGQQAIRLGEKAGLALTVFLLASITGVIIFGYSGTGAFSPPNLALVLNTIFITVASFLVAGISAQSFLRYGQIGFVFLTCALIISGATALLAGWAAEISANANFTILGMGLLISAIVQVFGALYLSSSIALKALSHKETILAAALIASLACVAALTTLTLLGFTAPFFTATGPTSLRQFVIGLSVFFFASSSLIIGYQYVQLRARALYWYSLALALFAVGSLGLYNTANLGDLSQWIGRVALYVGGIYFIIVILTLSFPAYSAGFSERWFEIFSNNRKQLDALFSNLLNGFAYLRVVYDEGGKPIDYVFLEVNDSFEADFGLKKVDVLGKRMTEVIKGIEQEPLDWIGIFGTVSVTAEPAKFEGQMQSIKKWFRVSAYSPDKGYVIALFDDISDRKENEQKLAEYSKNLESLVEERTKQLKDSERLAAIGQVAGMVGHDIRNPLQAIVNEAFIAKSSLDEMQENEETKSLKESVELIEKQTAYIQRIVGDLQDLAKPLRPELAQVNLCTAIPEAISTIEIPGNIKKKVICEVPELLLELDLAFLKRIMVNLVTNGIQAMPKGGELTIRAFAKENSAFVTVEDTGVGIPKEVQEKLFTPLFTTKAKGQGFGLVAIKRMTEALGGKISFESQVGKGTKFTVEFPLKPRQV